jgi:hypothetical protein
MANESIRLEIDKSSGQILKLFYKGNNLVGSGKGYMQSNDENGFMSPKQTELIIARSDDHLRSSPSKPWKKTALRRAYRQH